MSSGCTWTALFFSSVSHGANERGRDSFLPPARRHPSVSVDSKRNTGQPQVEVRRPARADVAGLHQVQADCVCERQILTIARSQHAARAELLDRPEVEVL